MANSGGMGCFNHPEATAVASCPKCGKFLCKECAQKNASKLCDDCEAERIAQNNKDAEKRKADFHNRTKAVKNDSIIDLVKSAVISLIFAFIGFQVGKADGNGLTFAYMFAGLPWGWKVISKIMDSGVMFFAALSNNFLIAFIIKFVLGELIGAFVWPFIIGYKIYLVIKAHNLEKSAR